MADTDIELSGSQIRLAREAAGVSQYRLAKYLGISSGLLSGWERGNATPSATRQAEVKCALDQIDQLVASGQIPSGRRGVPITHNAPPKPGIHTDCCADGERQPDTNTPRALALFAGCGGLASGFATAGYEIAGFVEIDKAARSSFKANFPYATCVAHDITEPTNEELVRLRGELGVVDLIVGGPPCQGFSLAGKRDPGDPRNVLYREVLRYAMVWNVKLIVMENVRLLLSMRDEEGILVIDRVADDFHNAGYEMVVHSVNAQDFGVPQSRERILIVGVSQEVASAHPEWATPAPRSHGETSNLLDGHLSPVRTFRDATSDLEALEAGEHSETDPLHWAVNHPEHVLRWLRHVPEGMSAHDNEDPSLRPPSGYNTTYKRLIWDEPASTIGTTFGMISASRNVHPQATRSITIREAARCQTFPDSYIFEGTWGDVRKQIGNAVPPKLAEAWANHLKCLATGPPCD